MGTRKLIGTVLATNAAIMAVLLLALWAASSVAAVPSPVEQAGVPSLSAQVAPTPVPGGPRYYSVGSLEMLPGDSTIGYTNWGAWLSTTQESTVNPLGLTVYNAVLHLPQGARITKLVAYGYDDDPSKDFSFGLYRITMTDTVTSDPVVPITMTASGTDVGPFVKEIIANEDFATVDNSVYHYVLNLCLEVASPGCELKIAMFRVDYTFDGYATPVI